VGCAVSAFVVLDSAALPTRRYGREIEGGRWAREVKNDEEELNVGSGKSIRRAAGFLATG